MRKILIDTKIIDKLYEPIIRNLQALLDNQTDNIYIEKKDEIKSRIEFNKEFRNFLSVNILEILKHRICCDYQETKDFVKIIKTNKIEHDQTQPLNVENQAEIDYIFEFLFNYNDFKRDTLYKYTLNTNNIVVKERDNKKDFFSRRKLTNLLHDIKVCPYCNLQYIETVQIENEEGKIINFAFDHFLCKSKYPFFSLSVYNLIPSCAICNEYLKNKKDFLCSEHSKYECLNPYFFDFHSIVCYNVKINVSSDQHSSNDIRIDLEPKNSYTKESKEYKEFRYAVNTDKVFCVRERISENHYDYLFSIDSKFRMYNNTYREGLKSVFKDLDDNQIIHILFDNYRNEEEINKYALSKITIDMINQYLEDERE